MLTGGTGLSAGREREGGGAGWAVAQEGARGVGFVPKWPKRRNLERERLFPFYFPKKISNSFPNEFF